MDIEIPSLTYKQVQLLWKVLEVMGPPVIAEDVPPMVVVLQAAQKWYLAKGQVLREGGDV